jgi:hypothetical protein
MYPRRNILYTQWKGGWVHHRACMDTGKEKDLFFPVEMNTHYLVSSRLQPTNCTTQLSQRKKGQNEKPTGENLLISKKGVLIQIMNDNLEGVIPLCGKIIYLL